MNICDAIDALQKAVPNPEKGLPDSLFYYTSSMTPLVNVDLLIKDENGRTLLAWRNDQYAGEGWHLPGGIIRFRETFVDRIKKVAEIEVGTLVDFDPNPIAINQIINNENPIRGHFISILFRCSLSSAFVPENNGISASDAGYLKWHDTCPKNLLTLQDIYREYF